MKGLYTVASLLAAATAIPTGEPPTYGSNTTQPGWSVDKFKNFITFGDSYTDENRLGYFASHNGSAPPTGTILPESFNSADGGRVWARYVVQYTEQSLSLYNYAVSGAVCSNNITPRLFETINAPFPDLEGYEIPAFLADKAQNVNIDTGGPFFTTPLTDENAVYAFFDGTNDIGIEAFFTDSQVDGKVLSDYVDCIYNQMDRIYASGGRYFVVFNLTPLELLSLYANESAGGTGSDRYWNPKPTNLTEISDRMREFTTTLNSVFEYRTPYEVLVKNRYPGAHFASFDVNKIFLDIYNNPATYLNGTAPLQVTGYSNKCDVNGQNCVLDPSPDSFEWFDSLHPSEQTERIIAQKFIDLLGGSSEYAAYYDSPS